MMSTIKKKHGNRYQAKSAFTIINRSVINQSINNSICNTSQGWDYLESEACAIARWLNGCTRSSQIGFLVFLTEYTTAEICVWIGKLFPMRDDKQQSAFIAIWLQHVLWQRQDQSSNSGSGHLYIVGRQISWEESEGSTVSSLNCDR